MHRRDALLLLAAALPMSLALGACGKKEPLAAAQQPYAGRWEAADGTFVQIYMDGGGDFKMSNSNVTGGSAKIDGSTLHIGLGPIGKDFKIDQAPTQSGSAWTMKLDGIVYTKK